MARTVKPYVHMPCKMKLTPFAVRIVVQTTHVDHDLPSEVCITYPLHPLVGKHLKVVGRHRKSQDIFWLVVMPDGSHAHIPSSWTDHTIGNTTFVHRESNTRASPEVLREFIALMEVLVSGPSPCNNCKNDIVDGGEDERANRTVRNRQDGLGASGLEDCRNQVTRPGDRPAGKDGKSCLGRRKGRGK